MERFNLRKENDVDVKEQCWVKISKRFAALENLSGGGGDDDDVDINRGWEDIREVIKASTTDSRLL
jgi:hypothetical protein